MPKAWRHCSICKKEILCGGPYTVCSVSTCNRQRTGLVFCSLECWEEHLPVARHREAWAEDRKAPLQPDADPPRPGGGPSSAGSREVSSPPRRRIVPSERRDPNLPLDVLVVASKLKAYVRAASGMNTSDAVIDVLSDRLRTLCDRAIERARADGRKTLMDRDFS